MREEGFRDIVRRWHEAGEAVERYTTTKIAEARGSGDLSEMQVAEGVRDWLSDQVYPIRDKLYETQPSNVAECVTLLEIIRKYEEDVFLDEYLATAIDNVIGALKRTA